MNNELPSRPTTAAPSVPVLLSRGAEGPFWNVSGVYGLQHVGSGRWYIGQSINIGRRKHRHWVALTRNQHINPFLQKIANEEGVDSFSFQVLEITDRPNLNECERKWIAHYKSTNTLSGYNIKSGGHHINPVSEATRRKISASLKGKKRGPMTPEHRLNLSISHRGHKLSEETRRKMSISRTGIKRGPLTEERRLKLSLAQRGRCPWNKGVPRPQETKDKMSATIARKRSEFLAKSKNTNLTNL